MRDNRFRSPILRRFTFAVAIALLSYAIGNAAAADHSLTVFVSDQWDGPDEIDLRTLRKIFLGKQTRFHGKPVLGLHLPEGSPEREGFERSVLRKSKQLLGQYWIEQALSGGHLPPREFANTDEIIAEVKQHPGTIGYADEEKLSRGAPGGIQILKVSTEGITFSPEDPDYPLLYRPELVPSH